MKISDIKPNPQNPRTIKDENFKKLVQSIKDFPEMLDARPLVLNKDNVILGGNMRFKASKEAGLKEVPVKIVDWSEEKQREFIIKDNISGGDWDWDQLANEWDVEQLDEWGLDVPDFAGDVEVEEDEAPEVSDEPPVSKLGEVYQLGRHRVMCGNAENCTELIDDTFFLYADPPYGISIGSQSQGKGGGVAKKIDYGANEWDSSIPKEAINQSILNTSGYVLWGANYYTDIITPSQCWIVWDKDNGATDFADVELAATSIDKASRLVRYKWAGMLQEDMKNKEDRVHPTQKPVGMHVDVFKRLSLPQKIADTFLGSGSTLIACEQTDRTCYGMELDPKYTDVIRKRYAKFVYPDRWEEEWESLTPEAV